LTIALPSTRDVLVATSTRSTTRLRAFVRWCEAIRAAAMATSVAAASTPALSASQVPALSRLRRISRRSDHP
jgi:hypothetical protein